MDSFEALISSDAPGPHVKDEFFDLDDFLDFDDFLARQTPTAPDQHFHSDLPCDNHAYPQHNESGVEGFSPRPSLANVPASASLPVSFPSSCSADHDAFEVPKRELLKTEAPRNAAPIMSNAEYLSRIKCRPIASAANRPPPVPKVRERGKREKTGCFTCRKRRIKCDERLPTCRNCEKSRKKCGGYDPKNQPDPSWNSLAQPLPSSAISNSGTYNPSSSVAVQSSSPLAPLKRKRNETASSSLASTKRSKLNLPSPPQSSHSTCAVLAPSNPMASAPAAPQPGGAPYNAVFANTLNAQASNIPQNRAYGSTPSAYQPSLWSEAHSRIEKQRDLRIEDLYLMGGADPPTPRVEQPIPEDILEEIKDLYFYEYARGIDAFLETTWYSQHGHKHLLADGRLLEMFAGMVEIFRTAASSDFEVQHRLPSTEARIVWLLICLARKAALSGPDEVQVTLHERQELLPHLIARLAILEHILTGRSLQSNPLLALAQNAQYASVQQSRQHRFWGLLGHLVTLRSDEAGRSAADAALTSVSRLLDGMENRDVLYSVAVVRHLGDRTPDFPDKLVPGTVSVGLSSEDKKKLLVSKKFLEDEASEGTHQVVQRICGMARRGWTHLRTA